MAGSLAGGRKRKAGFLQHVADVGDLGQGRGVYANAAAALEVGEEEAVAQLVDGVGA